MFSLILLSALTAGADDIQSAKTGDERVIGGVKMCWCPAGKFTMGSPHNEPERRYDHIGFRVVAVQAK